MASVKALTDLTLRDLWREVKDPATPVGRHLTRNDPGREKPAGKSHAR